MRELILCRVQKGDDYRYVWVPEHVAIIHAPVQITIDGVVDHGWKIIRIRRDHHRSTNDSEGERQMLLGCND